MFTAEQAIEFTKHMASEVPADRDDLDHEGNVNQYLKFVARHRRAFAHAYDADVSRLLWNELVELQEERHDVENGADLDTLLGIRNTQDNREAQLDYLDQQINVAAAVLVKTAQEF